MYRDFENTNNGRTDLTVNIYEIGLSEESIALVNKIIEENPDIGEIFKSTENAEQAAVKLRSLVMSYLVSRPQAFDYYSKARSGENALNALDWRDYAAIRILDYIDHEGTALEDPNLGGKMVYSHPVKLLWLAINEGKGAATIDYYRDMLHLFRQFTGKKQREIPDKKQIESWMQRHPSGLDPEVVEERKRNRYRIIRLFIKKIDSGDIERRKYQFEPGMTFWQKYRKVLDWWNDPTFHLQFAARSPERLNRMLGRSLEDHTLDTLLKAQDVGIPFFVNPYYLSLLNVSVDEKYRQSDRAVRDYIFVSEDLVNEFGKIVAWEKEDIVEPGKPNAAGWLLPNRKNIHRRYPEVAILIPDTIGRACGGLCVSCQRMYDFQNGHLNFDLDDLKPVETWWERLPKLLKYFEYDSQLRDILITGGDSLMSSDKSLKRILDEVYKMALRKKEANKLKPDGEKFAEMQRIRLGTRMPVYLPQRITDSLIQILKDFKEKASAIGFEQFVIQTHFESAMEVTPESAEAVRKLISAGWIVTNQLVFTAAASRRGHTAKLRKVLNDIGVLTYYTFTVKGFRENAFTFANNARIVQEQVEEKRLGAVPEDVREIFKGFPKYAEGMVENIESLRRICNIPFLATDRSVMNLPGVGKSLSFRTIGITADGRRILKFGYDHNRNHSPVIDTLGEIVIIESRSIAGYLKRMEEMGEDLRDYNNLWGYSIGETESRIPVFEYPEFDYKVADILTNFEIQL